MRDFAEIEKLFQEAYKALEEKIKYITNIMTADDIFVKYSMIIDQWLAGLGISQADSTTLDEIRAFKRLKKTVTKGEDYFIVHVTSADDNIDIDSSDDEDMYLMISRFSKYSNIELLEIKKRWIDTLERVEAERQRHKNMLDKANEERKRATEYKTYLRLKEKFEKEEKQNE